jgi:hypothetical protein
MGPEIRQDKVTLWTWGADAGTVRMSNQKGSHARTVYRNRLIRLSRRANLGRVATPHALWHTFASMESDTGIEATSLAHLMGQSSTRTLGAASRTRSNMTEPQCVRRGQARGIARPAFATCPARREGWWALQDSNL